jgi:hypothetical protein
MFTSHNEVSWSNIKSFLDSKKIPAQYINFQDTYWILAADGPFQVWCRIPIVDPASDDQTDFEINYLPNANTVLTDSAGHTIVKAAAFSDSEGFRARFKGFKGIASKNDSQDPEKISLIDFHVPEERYINGVRLMLTNHSDDDNIEFIVVDKNYTYAGILYPAEYDDGQGTVLPWSVAAPNGLELDTFGETWYVDSSICTQSDVIVPYPARILSDLYIRIKYHATGTQNDVIVKANIYLHKKD